MKPPNRGWKAYFRGAVGFACARNDAMTFEQAQAGFDQMLTEERQEAIREAAPKIWEHATGAWNPSSSDRDRAEHLHSLRKLLAAASGNTWIKETKA